jgi:hypothetical protein
MVQNGSAYYHKELYCQGGKGPNLSIRPRSQRRNLQLRNKCLAPPDEGWIDSTTFLDLHFPNVSNLTIHFDVNFII